MPPPPQDEADARSDVFPPRRKTRRRLRSRIKQTGKDYDDAHAAVAQLARDEMHGLECFRRDERGDGCHQHTGTSSTPCSPGRVVPQRGNAASSAATSLEHVEEPWRALGGHRKQIAVLKTQSDEKAASCTDRRRNRAANVTLWTSYARRVRRGATNCPLHGRQSDSLIRQAGGPDRTDRLPGSIPTIVSSRRSSRTPPTGWIPVTRAARRPPGDPAPAPAPVSLLPPPLASAS